MSEAHVGVVGGKYMGKKSTCKILQEGLWCLTMHMDTKIFYRHCDICKRIGKSPRRDKMPLTLEITLQDFEKWDVLLD